MALLTVRMAADRLGVAYSTLKRWVHTGHVRTTRTEGGHHRVSDAEIDRLLARQQPEGTRSTPTADPDEVLGGLSARNRLTGSSTKYASMVFSRRCGCESAIRR